MHAGAAAELTWEEADVAEHQWPGRGGGHTNQPPLSNSRAVPAPLPREGSQGRQNFKYFGVILFYFILHKWKQKLVSRVVWSFPGSKSTSSSLLLRWGEGQDGGRE